MSIPNEIIDEVIARTDIVSLISQYVTLKKSGKNFKGLCPFHSEKTPSFLVHPDKGFFKCFGCGEGGGAIQFLMKIENLAFPEAIRILAERAGVAIKTTPQEKRVLSEKAKLRNLIKASANFYHEMLVQSPVGRKGLAYFKERGVSLDVIKKFGLGYAPASGDFLLRKLLGFKFTYQEMEKSGIVRRYGGQLYDFFKNRIIFPITDSQGRPVGLGGRILEKDAGPKYLNTPESMLFRKGTILYGLSQAKSAIRKEEEVYVVEGYMDAIALYQAGFYNAVASMGTSLTPDQSKALSRYTRRVIFAYDADAAGSAATIRGIEIFEKAGLYVRIMDIPPGEDPDSVIRKKGVDFFRELTANSRSIIDYKLDNLIKRYDLRTPESKQEFFKELIPVLREVRGGVRLSEYIRLVSERCKIPENFIRRAVVGKKVRKKVPDASPVFNKRLKLPEEILLNSVLLHPEFIPLLREYDIDETCMGRHFYEIFIALRNFNSEGVEIISADILGKILKDDNQLKTAIDLSMKEGAKDCNEEQVRKFLEKLAHRKIEKDHNQSFREKLAKGTLSHDDPDFIKYMASLRNLRTSGKQ